MYPIRGKPDRVIFPALSGWLKPKVVVTRSTLVYCLCIQKNKAFLTPRKTVRDTNNCDEAFRRQHMLKALDTIRVFLADDHPVVRQGLAMVMDGQADIEIVGEARDPGQLISGIEATRPDVLILDLDLDPHSDDDMAVLTAVRKLHPGLRIVVYTAHDDEKRVVEAMEYGVEGYILKSANPEELLTAIRVVHRGGTLMQPSVASTLMRHMRHAADHRQPSPDLGISPREFQVLRLMADGQSNQQIADQLVISERTVKFHVSSILSKLEVVNRTAAVLKADREGILNRA